MTLSSKQKQHLKAKAHKLKPVILLGNQGLTDAVKKEIDRALNDHELIKIHIPIQDREERRAVIADICTSLSAESIQSIGLIAVIYRKLAE
jgi:RNA-binding protein